jgi:hypothetical protein
MRKGWKPSDSFVYLASVVVKEGHISSILKYYDLGDGSDLSTVFSTALRDAQRDQTGPCLTTLVRGSDQSVQTIKTLCGHYELDFHLAHIDSANSGRSTTSISVFVR